MQIEYPPFEKNFYDEHEEITSLTPQQVVELRHKLNLRVSCDTTALPAAFNSLSALDYLSLNEDFHWELQLLNPVLSHTCSDADFLEVSYGFVKVGSEECCLD